MKLIGKIIILLIFLVILTAEDCSNLGSESTVVETRTDFYAELEKDFKTESLSPDKLKAFEERSLQMIDDLVDYLNIYSDTEKHVEFRKQSRELIQEMFVSDEDLDVFFDMMDIWEDKTNYKILVNGKKNAVFILESKKIAGGLKFNQNENYDGKLEFVVSVLKSENEKRAVDLNTILKKVEKQFGQESNLVWKVFFVSKNP